MDGPPNWEPPAGASNLRNLPEFTSDRHQAERGEVHMAGAGDRYSGVQRAAIVMMALGEQFTADMFKRMDQNDIRRVGVAMSNME